MFIAALSSELSEKMAIGGKLTLMGILIVFGLLALIVVVLTIMERIMRKSGEKPKKERKNLKELFKNKMQKNEPKPKAIVTPTASETLSTFFATLLGLSAILLSPYRNVSTLAI